MTSPVHNHNHTIREQLPKRPTSSATNLPTTCSPANDCFQRDEQLAKRYADNSPEVVNPCVVALILYHGSLAMTMSAWACIPAGSAALSPPENRFTLGSSDRNLSWYAQDFGQRIHADLAASTHNPEYFPANKMFQLAVIEPQFHGVSPLLR
ncbi:uncharacterized protein BT62DRAFT_1081237 [Guyanagaster necrorhizus]|uniref:Uncharacterized protein n=1 Tax=Guyanagaster necrorhizus TaxID=856835 RepID=A0A9P8ALR8_9AGAR|nr:uncharacterized protein BT62DRAFT_1081237 [Guyanagaster necrorhizus MCA 3950]KAG7439984.1 hypothetical protein BT62DRAFT_1081237 [Guyanagaster necrorhizus MCA 3950]